MDFLGPFYVDFPKFSIRLYLRGAPNVELYKNNMDDIPSSFVYNHCVVGPTCDSLKYLYLYISGRFKDFNSR